MVVRLGNGISGWVALHGEAVRTGNVKADPRYIEADPRTQSELCVPLKAGGRVIGALNVESEQPDAFSEHDEQLLTTVAASAAVAIENARLYQALQDHASRLEETVARRTAELTQREAALRAANEKLKELDRLKSQFVSNVSHELRTPLANIIAYLYLLEEGKPEKFKQYVATLNREANLLQQLIEDLLLLSRLDLDRAHPSLSVLDINEVVSRLANDRGLLMEKRGLSLQFGLAPGQLLAHTDRKMLLQIITNLMTNAMNYTPAGGTITLTTEMRDGPPHAGQHAAVRAAPEWENGRWAVVSVSDTGPGISPEDLAHLFERFYRGDAARQSSVPGTGLGLAICKELADRLDATVTVQSQLGQGSTFSVWLPVGEKPLS
jgi:signal transduction histidine kinase